MTLAGLMEPLAQVPVFPPGNLPTRLDVDQAEEHKADGEEQDQTQNSGTAAMIVVAKAELSYIVQALIRRLYSIGLNVMLSPR